MIVLQKLLKCLKNWLGSAQKKMSTCIPSKKTFSTLLSLDSYSEILLKQFYLPFLCKTVTKMCSKLMWVPPKEMSLCNPSNYFHPAKYESIQYDTVKTSFPALNVWYFRCKSFLPLINCFHLFLFFSLKKPFYCILLYYIILSSVNNQF